jgi:hypothetical protein
MAHLRTPQADSDLDDIWYYVSTKSAAFRTSPPKIEGVLKMARRIDAYNAINERF